MEDQLRFKELWGRGHPFFHRFFTDDELASAERSNDMVSWLTGRFCAKEAIAKAIMELGDRSPDFRDIEILSRDDGCPTAKVKGSVDRYLINISISHSGEVAIAFAIVNSVP